LLLLAPGDEAIERGAQQRADDRRYPEEPQLADGPVADEQGNAVASGRVHRGVGDRDAGPVDQREGQADGKRRAARRSPLAGRSPEHEQAGSVVTTSQTRAACSE
jgi:hypothetical protein